MKVLRHATTASKPHKLTAMLSREDLRKLRKLATKENVGVSHMVRLLVQRYYAAAGGG